jgi:ABC-type sugar transport system substrate-binding protein
MFIFVAVLLLFAIPTTVFGRGKQEGSGGDSLKIGIAMQSISTNPIFINAVNMIQKECDEQGYTLIAKELTNGAEDIPSALENLEIAGCNIIIIHVLSADTVAPLMGQLKSKGILVAAYDTNVEGSTYCFMADNYQVGYNIGKMAGDWLKKTTGGKGTAAILTYDLTDEFRKRGNGMEDGFYEICPQPDSKIVIRTAGTWVDEATSATENILSAYPDINVIMTLGELGALTSYEVFKAAGKGKESNLGIFTAEITNPGIAAMRDGGIYRGTISVELDKGLYEMFLRSVKTYQTGIVDKEYAVTYFPMTQVTLENLDKYLAD